MRIPVSVSTRVIAEWYCPEFLTDFHQILYTAQKCGPLQIWCFLQKAVTDIWFLKVREFRQRQFPASDHHIFQRIGKNSVKSINSAKSTLNLVVKETGKRIRFQRSENSGFACSTNSLWKWYRPQFFSDLRGICHCCTVRQNTAAAAHPTQPTSQTAVGDDERDGAIPALKQLVSMQMKECSDSSPKRC